MEEEQVAKIGEGGGLCEWFALCDRPAYGLVTHPVLAQVPVCERCAEKLGLTFLAG